MIHFGAFTLDSEQRLRWRDGIRVNLLGQPYQILPVLLANAGKLVTRDEIRETLWPGDTFVDFEHGLNTSSSRFRNWGHLPTRRKIITPLSS